MASHVAFKYRYNSFDGGVVDNEFAFRSQQAIEATKRMAASIELPFDRVSEPGDKTTVGIGDMKLQLRGTLQKKEKCEQAAGAELSLPSAGANVVGHDQLILRLVWGFTGQLARKTLLSGELGYNKALVNQGADHGVNSIGPDLILIQELTRRLEPHTWIGTATTHSTWIDTST